MERHKKSIKGITKLKARLDRKPLDTPKVVHEYLDTAFKKKFGWKARSEAVFAGSSPDIAESYGPTYLIYPINGYSYLYSKDIPDLSQYLKTIDVLDWNNKNRPMFRLGREWLNDETKAKKLIDKTINKYTNKNLPKASYETVEVMLNCPNGYYLIDGDYFSLHYQQIEQGYYENEEGEWISLTD